MIITILLLPLGHISFTTLMHEHNEGQRPRHRGSTRPRKANVKGNWEAGHQRLCRDYFHDTTPLRGIDILAPVPDVKNLFLEIMQSVRDYDLYFLCKPNATGKLGFTSYQKSSAAIRMLAYGVVGDLIDEYLRVSETTCLELM
jgi:hypothetical protein